MPIEKKAYIVRINESLKELDHQPTRKEAQTIVGGME